MLETEQVDFRLWIRLWKLYKDLVPSGIVCIDDIWLPRASIINHHEHDPAKIIQQISNEQIALAIVWLGRDGKCTISGENVVFGDTYFNTYPNLLSNLFEACLVAAKQRDPTEAKLFL